LSRNIQNLAITAALASLALAAGCVNRGAQAQAKKQEELISDPTQPVQVATVRAADMRETFEITGAIAAGDQSQVGSPVGGRVVSVYVKDGDTVSTGQVVAQLETQDLTARLRQAQSQADAARSQVQQAQADAAAAPSRSDAAVKAAQARLNQAKARLLRLENGSRSEERIQAEWGVKRAKSDLDTAEAALRRAERLFNEGAIARVELEAAQNRQANAMAGYEAALQTLSLVQNSTRPEDLTAAREDVRAAEEALRVERANKTLDVVYRDRVVAARANLNSAEEQVRLARKALSDATVRAPFSGRVSGRPVQAGTVVAPGTPILTVVGGGGIYFDAQVPEKAIARVSPGMAVRVTLPSLPNLVLTGRVAGLDPQASSVARQFSVRVALNESLGAVRPGMFARGELNLGSRSGVPAVPTAAIVQDGEKAHVFAVRDKKATRVEVKIGLVADGLTEVSGLRPGEQVIVTGQANLVDGTPVRIEDPKAAEQEPTEPKQGKE
jgi:HlyD family secretion protein